MFAWDYSIFAIVIITVPVLLVFGVWIIYTLSKVERLKDYSSGRLRQCPFCTHVRVSMNHFAIERCPCCGSFYDGG